MVLLHRCFLSNFFQPLLASAGDTFKEQSVALIMAMLSSATATARKRLGSKPAFVSKVQSAEAAPKDCFCGHEIRVGNEKRVILKEFEEQVAAG